MKCLPTAAVILKPNDDSNKSKIIVQCSFKDEKCNSQVRLEKTAIRNTVMKTSGK